MNQSFDQVFWSLNVWCNAGIRRAAACASRWLSRSVTAVVSSLMLSSVLLAACQMPAKDYVSPITGNIGPPPMFINAIKTCRATDARFLLGQVVTRELLGEAQLRTRSRSAQTVLPNNTHILVLDVNRLLVDVDTSGRAVVLRCG
jgi:hypothetical protein